MFKKEKVKEIDEKIESLRFTIIEAIDNYGNCDIHTKLCFDGSYINVRIINIENGLYTYNIKTIYGEETDVDDLSLLSANELYEIFQLLNE